MLSWVNVLKIKWYLIVCYLGRCLWPRADTWYPKENKSRRNCSNTNLWLCQCYQVSSLVTWLTYYICTCRKSTAFLGDLYTLMQLYLHYCDWGVMNVIIQDFPRCKDHCLKMQDANSKMELVRHKWEFVILDFEELKSKVSETCYFLLVTSECYICSHE